MSPRKPPRQPHQRQRADARPETSARTGLVIAHYRRELEIEDLADGTRQRCHRRGQAGEPVTGDRVLWQPGPDMGMVESILPRRSLLSRPDERGHLRPVAANIDRIALVIAPEPEPHARLIDRYLVTAELTGIPVLLVCNKCDQEIPGTLAGLLQRYRRIGYPVLETSCYEGRGLTALRSALQGQACVLVGQSGVGKSSLINALVPSAAATVGALSAAAGKGRHTTTTARLFHTPFGADIIDSPGIRDFGLWPIEPGRLAEGFPELRSLLGQCRFRNCRHDREPGCALQAALAQGRVSPERMASFEAMRATLVQGPQPHRPESSSPP